MCQNFSLGGFIWVPETSKLSKEILENYNDDRDRG